MTFQSLYRKHRPQQFAEVVGQEHVTTALRNAVREDRVGHAYLFSGPRGTGKTTTARLLAKALNCTDLGDDAEPCGECDSCTEIARGRESATVIERDAASARGVEDMRELLRGVDLSVPGKRKVYILDEVHMLTDAASNTLLKTLEEPLSHVVFVLATTEPEKVLPTIRSRTQHFQFSLLPTEQIADHLADVVQREGLEAEAEALRIVARRGAGSVRDSLSLLDQALALGDGGVDEGRVRALFEVTPFALRSEILDALGAEDAAGAVTALGRLLESGADPRHVADELLRHLRDVFLIAASRGEVAIDAPEEEAARMAEQGSAIGYQNVVRAIETLGDAALDMRRAPDPRLVLEVALVRLARREAGTRTEVLLDRVERLERALDELRSGGGTPAPAAPPAGAPTAASTPAEPAAKGSDRPALGGVRGKRKAKQPAPEPETPPAAEAPPAAPAADAQGELDLDDVIVAWPQVLDGMKGMLKAIAREAQPVAVDAKAVVLGLPEKLQHQRDKLEANLREVGDALGRALGRQTVPLRVDVHEGFLDDAPPAAETPAAPAAEPEPEIEVVDIEHETVEAKEGGVDSVDRLVEAFDGTVEEGEGS